MPSPQVTFLLRFYCGYKVDMNHHRTPDTSLFQSREWATRWAARVILLGAIVIVVSTLYPFKFTALNHSLLQELFRGLRQRSSPLDFFANIVLFAPVGFGFACALAKRRASVVTKLLTIMLICGALSLTIEILQIFLPSRKSSFSDIISNAVGGGVGFLGFQFAGVKLHQWGQTVGQVLHRLLAKVSLPQLVWAIALYILFASFSVNYWQASSLKGWRSDFLLSIGNTDAFYSKRLQKPDLPPWTGTIADVMVSDRALSKPQVAAFFAEPQSFIQNNSAILAAYPLRGQDGTQDLTGQSPDLTWRGSRPTTPTTTANGTVLSANQWLQTPEPVTLLNSRIRNSAEFTLSGLVTLPAIAERSPQFHPVIAIAGPYGNNLSLSLFQSGLHLMLTVARTPRNQRIYRETISNVLLDTQPHRFVVSYSSFVLRVYIDGAEQLYVADVTPNRYQIMFYLLLLVPLALLILLATNRLTHRLPLYLVLIGGGTLLPALMLEGFLANGGDRKIRLANLLLGVLIMGGTMVAFKGNPLRHFRWFTGAR